MSSKDCLKCGKEFISNRPLRKYCSQSCQIEMWRQSNVKHLKEYRKNYDLTNKEKIKEYKYNYYRENIDYIKDYHKQYFQKNKEVIWEKRKEYVKKYSKENPNFSKLKCANRRARIKNATPKWANMKKIKDIYSNCPKGYQVDHIIPLNGKTVSGLHIPENLQYLTPQENRSKSNRIIHE